MRRAISTSVRSAPQSDQVDSSQVDTSVHHTYLYHTRPSDHPTPSAADVALTVAPNFSDHRMVGIASNSEHWFPAHGTFEVVDG